MGNQNYRAKLLSAIEKGRLDRIKEIVEAVPSILEEDLNSTMKVTPLARAVWRGDFESVALLVQYQLGANVNNGGTDSVTPLMWAARRDNAYMVSNLIDFGADLTLKSNEGIIYDRHYSFSGFTALDYAIVHGNYRPALFLFDFFQDLKEILDYYQFAKDRDYRYVNYEMFLVHLKQRTSYQQIPNIFQRPEKKKYLDPVIDPREPWKKMVSRLIEFEEPPIVERSELPTHLQPQNRFWGKVRSQLNGMDPNPKHSQHEEDEVIAFNDDIKASPNFANSQAKRNQVQNQNEESVIQEVNIQQVEIK